MSTKSNFDSTEPNPAKGEASILMKIVSSSSNPSTSVEFKALFDMFLSDHIKKGYFSY
jgi:hypothetical protein